MNLLVKNTILCGLVVLLSLKTFGQIDPQSSPYYANGTYDVLNEAHTDVNPNVYSFRPDVPVGETFPVFIFQLGANGFGGSAIDHTSYDIFMEHLASWGYIVLVIDDASAGLPNGGSFSTVYDWYNGKISDNSHWLSDFANNDKVVVGGHSNGGVNATGFLQDHKQEIEGVVFFASYPSEGILGFGAHNIADFPGYVLSIAGDEDGQSTPSDCFDGYELFEEAACKYYVNIDGLGHGGFGDYDNPDQPVGSIGRDNATASIRHYLVSFMELSMKGNQSTEQHLKVEDFQPNTTKEYESTCPFEGVDEDDDDPVDDDQDDPVDEEDEDPIDDDEDDLEDEDPIDEEEDTANLEEVELELTIFPNPTQSTVNIIINEEIETVSVYDNTGKKVVVSISENVLDFTNLSKGVYFVHVNNNYIHKVVKQ